MRNIRPKNMAAKKDTKLIFITPITMGKITPHIIKIIYMFLLCFLAHAGHCRILKAV